MMKGMKVRKPGHGESFEKHVKSMAAKARAMGCPMHDNSMNSHGKKEVR